MAIWSRIRETLGGGGLPGEDAPGWKTLRYQGITDNFLVWAQRDGGDLSTVWGRCPRADWLVGLAARAGVDRRLILEAVKDCVSQLSTDRGRLALRAAQAFAERRSGVEALCEPLALAVDEFLDRNPDLDRARAARSTPVGRRFPTERISADMAERHSLLRLAEEVRKRISFEDVRRAIWGESAGESPYR